MEYKVTPFVANVQSQEGATTASAQLESTINGYANEGWEFIRMESVETFIAGTSGCFGIGAQPGGMTSYSMLVFKR